MTTTGIKYPGTVTQNATGTYIEWSALNNIKTGTNSSQTHAVQTNMTPAPITCSGFNLNLPDYYQIDTIEFSYKHRKNPNSQGKYPAFAQPEIRLYDGNTLISKVSGDAPSATMTERTVTFPINGSIKKDYNNGGHDFKIEIRYPRNTSVYTGYIEIQWVTLKVNYTFPNYLIQIGTVDRYGGSDFYTGVYYQMVIQIYDKNTVENLTVPATLTIPEGMTIETYDEGEPVDLNQFITGGSLELNLKVYYDTAGTYPVTVTTGNGQTKTKTITVTNRPTGYHDDEVFDEEQIFYATENTEFTLPIELNDELDYTGITNVYLWCDKQISYKNGSTWTTLNANTALTIPLSNFVNYLYNLKLKTGNGANRIYLSLSTSMPDDATYVIYTVPANISSSYPIMTILKLTDAELELLSPGSVYSIESELSVNELIPLSEFTDYFRNYRIGVVNTEVTESTSTIFDACRNWSSAMTVYDEPETKTVEFVYNDDYPVYVIITGDYNYNNSLTKYQLQFTPPFLFLSEDERPINYDIVQLQPLHNTITDTEQAEIQLEAYQSTAPFTIYGYDIEEDIQTSENRAIRGIEIYGTITTGQKCTINATLISNEDDEYTQSTIINNNGEFKLGNSYDLWGYSVGDMINLSEWEVKIQIHNNFVNNTNDVMLNGLYLKVYYHDIDPQTVTIKINGEDLRWYNAYLEDLKIPIGLNLDTQYMEINGKDTNKPVNQAIRSKEITATLIVDGCDINETTQMVKQLNKLLVTERDSLNVPVPNILEFSNRPDEHFEYILEDEFDTDIEVASYETDIKFIIPDGVSYSNEDTVTGPIGRVNSLTKVNPIITVGNIQTDNLEIVEENTGQTFSINYPFQDTDIIEIDCLTHTVELNPVDDEEYGTELKTFVDISSDWFYLNDDYSFTCETAIIQSVRYNERG